MARFGGCGDLFPETWYDVFIWWLQMADMRFARPQALRASSFSKSFQGVATGSLKSLSYTGALSG